MGYTAQEAAGLSGAIQADQLDRDEMAKTQRALTADQLLSNGSDGPFISAEQRHAAMSKRDAQGKRLYDTSEEYRRAVIHKISLSSDEVCGLYRPEANIPTNEQMIKQARIDVYNEKRSELMSKAAKGGPGSAEARLQLMEFYQDPANQAILAEYEKTYAESRPLEMEIRAAQARGERVGTSLQPTEEQIEQIEKHPYTAFLGTDDQGNPTGDGEANT
jgi:hypothetical protein